MLDIPFLLIYLAFLLASTLLYAVARLITRHPYSTVVPPTWPHVLSHDAPRGPLGIWEAHVAMRQHGRCNLGECARKRAAFEVLIEAERPEPIERKRGTRGGRSS
ncbi:hypothetical protein [Nocardia colli]|uniref:hypothetical protein n=1 Tax=Nocardia colli TaxID=2545717 RepID=UPI0035E29026